MAEACKMNYTEKEILDRLREDGKHPDLLYQKDYIREKGITIDTGRPYQEIAAQYLLSHREILTKTDTNWSMYHTKLQDATGDAARWVQLLATQKRFFRGVFLPAAVRLTDGVKADAGHFDCMTLAEAGDQVSLFQLLPFPAEENVLARTLRLWSWKESVNHQLLTQAMQMEKELRFHAVALVTGASNERYGSEKDPSEPVLFRRLAATLGVSTLYLFHGIYAEPINAALPAPGQMSRGELLQYAERDKDQPQLLYQKDYVNRLGVTSDTGEPYSQVLGEWLLQHRDIWMTVPHGLYRLVEGKRAEMMTKDQLFSQIRRQKVLPPFGQVLSRDMTFLGHRGQQLGRSALLLYDGDLQNERPYSLLRVVERVDLADTLLRALLRAFSHQVMIQKEKLLEDLRLPAKTQLESRLLIEADTPQYDMFLRDHQHLKSLMKAMGVGLILLKNGYEAMY